MLLFRRKTRKPLSVKRLTGATKWVNRVIFLAEHNLVLAACQDSAVRVYGIDTEDQPCAVFEQHTNGVHDVVQLDSDVVASVGSDKRLFTWRATTAELLGECKHSAGLLTVAKAGATKIIVGDVVGNVMVLGHQSPSKVELLRRFKAHWNAVNNIAVHADFFVTCSNDMTAKVWDASSLTLRTTYDTVDFVRSAAVSDKYIVTTCRSPLLNIVYCSDDYNSRLLLPLPEPVVGKAAFLNEDIVAVSGSNFLYLISLSAKSIKNRISMEKPVHSFAVLSDGRLAVGGDGGYCAIITPRKSVQGAVDDCAASLFPTSDIAIARVLPLRAAWLAVQDRQLTLAEACRTAITSDNCAASLGEWSIAHDLLMEAVKRGEIPASRHLDDSIAYWHKVLYQHCAKLAMGEKCIEFVTARFKEAEDAGVIAKGQIESLMNTIGIRRDMDTDNRFLVHATYQLFMRQAEMDVRLRQVLRYQRVQQVTAVLNALIGCIPVGGAIVTNVLSGGASILEEMDVCGLVESVLGIGKEAFGVFASDRLVDHVLQRSNVVLSVEEWKNVPAEKKKVVEEAASNLGLTIQELREKLLFVATMQSGGEYETPSAQVHVDDVEEIVKIEPVMSVEYVSEAVVSFSLEGNNAGGAGPSGQGVATTSTKDESERELKWWEEKGVRKNLVGQLKKVEAAACFSAFFLNYEPSGRLSFDRLKELMVNVFDEKLISGDSFAEANEEEQKVLLDVIVKALREVMDEDVLMLTKMRARKFIQLACQ